MAATRTARGTIHGYMDGVNIEHSYVCRGCLRGESGMTGVGPGLGDGGGEPDRGITGTAAEINGCCDQTNMHGASMRPRKVGVESRAVRIINSILFT